MTAGAPSASRPERATYLRPAGLDGVEALHASFVTHAYRPHSHPTWTLAMVVRGAAAFALDDTAQRAGDGDLFLLEPESVHTGAPAVPGGWAYKVLYLDPARVRRVGGGERRAARRRALGRVPRRAAVARARRRARARSRPSRRGSPSTRRCWRRSTPCARTCAPGRGRRGRRPEHAAVRRARAYLDERWAVRVPLAELAAHAGLSRFELARTFRAQVGLPPHAYQLDRRIARAPGAAGGRRAGRAGRAGVRVQRPAALHARVQARGRRHARRVRKIVQDARRGLSSHTPRWR